MGQAILQKRGHDSGVNFGDKWIVGDVAGDQVFIPRLETALRIEITLQLPDYRLRKRNISFKDPWMLGGFSSGAAARVRCCVVVRHRLLIMVAQKRGAPG